MSEKCFCHLNGYKVKDADARNEISKILTEIETLNQTIKALEERIKTLENNTNGDDTTGDDTTGDDTPDTIKISGGYDPSTGKIWGDWDISNLGLGNPSDHSYGRFNFYGYVDGVYIDGAEAWIDEDLAGTSKITIGSETVYEIYQGFVNIDRLSNKTISFGSTPQNFMTYQGEYMADVNVTNWFVNMATPIVYETNDIPVTPEVDTTSGNYNEITGEIYGNWDISNISEGGSLGITYGGYAHFKFYGYVDGVYKAGVDAYFWDVMTGITLYVDNEKVYEKSSGTVYTNKLTNNNIIGFGPQPGEMMRNSNGSELLELTTWFVGFATPIR